MFFEYESGWEMKTVAELLKAVADWNGPEEKHKTLYVSENTYKQLSSKRECKKSTKVIVESVSLDEVLQDFLRDEQAVIKIPSSDPDFDAIVKLVREELNTGTHSPDLSAVTQETH